MLQAQLNHLYGFVQDLNADRIAIAFSGGGDSTALLHALRDYPSVTHAFIIDHALRSGSAAEVAKAGEFARGLGYVVETARWGHDGITSGIQVKAREYRYAAMGQMCRAHGISHLLTAHTSDDQAETLLMRKARGTGWRGLAGMATSAYAPLWPALAEVNLHRPLLKVTRQALRDYNRRERLSWIDDPSNENEDFTRIRARQELSNAHDLKARLLAEQSESAARLRSERGLFGRWLAAHAEIDLQGFIVLNDVPHPELLLHLLRAVSGTGGPIDQARRAALAKKMRGPDFQSATLAGAWVVKDQNKFILTRDMVAVKGRHEQAGQADLTRAVHLRAGEALIWDGRYRITADTGGITVQAAYGQLQPLREASEFKHVFDLPKAVRPTLPVFKFQSDVIWAGAGVWEGVNCEALASRRLMHLFGKITA